MQGVRGRGLFSPKGVEAREGGGVIRTKVDFFYPLPNKLLKVLVVLVVPAMSSFEDTDAREKVRES